MNVYLGGHPTESDVLECAMQQVADMEYTPNVVMVHTWDAYRNGWITRLPRKLKKRLKRAYCEKVLFKVH